jgi:GntR family histidine utilization transcriptional repressor
VSTTLVQRIRADIEAEIRSGALSPGDRIPTEHELMQRYGCARMTVHQAISRLVGEGLIERRKKAGSFVATPHVQTAVLEIPDIAAVIQARGGQYRFALLNRARQDGARVEGFTLDGPVLVLDGLHVTADRPFALEHRIINLAAVPEAESVDFTAEAPGSWLLGHIPWTEAKHRISAQNAGTAARSLNIAKTAACLQVERWTWRQSEPVTFVRQLFPGDLYDLTAEFKPAG